MRKLAIVCGVLCAMATLHAAQYATEVKNLYVDSKDLKVVGKLLPTTDSIPFITMYLIGLILLFIFLWIIFIKTKERYLADTYIAFICLIAVFIGLFFFAVWTQVYPHLSSYDRMIHSP